jgi:hypothetical protein
VTNISSVTNKKFFLQNIITVDNAKQFDNDMFKDFYHRMGKNVAFTSVYNPQSNDMVERANTLIFEAIKKIREGEKKGKWAEVMPKAVWSHNTSVSRATNFSPFQLLFRAEAVTPEDIRHKSS